MIAVNVHFKKKKAPQHTTGHTRRTTRHCYIYILYVLMLETTLNLELYFSDIHVIAHNIEVQGH